MAPAPKASPVARLAGFVARVGGALVQPRRTFASLLRGDRGGLTDLLLLLLLQLVAVQLRALVSAAWFMGAVSFPAGFSSLLNLVAQSVLYPVAGVFLGTVVASFLTRGLPGRQRNVDLVALAAVPSVCLDLALTLIAALSGWRPGNVEVLVATGVGTLWFVALLVLAIGLVRSGASEEREDG